MMRVAKQTRTRHYQYQLSLVQADKLITVCFNFRHNNYK